MGFRYGRRLFWWSKSDAWFRHCLAGVGPKATFALLHNSSMHRAGAASDLTRMFGLMALTSGQHLGDDFSRVKQDGFMLRRRDLDEA